MADLTSEFQSFRSSSSPSSSFPIFLDIDPSMEPITQFTDMNQPIIFPINPNLNTQSFFSFSNDSFFTQQQPPEVVLHGNLAQGFPAGIFHHNNHNFQPLPHLSATVGHGSEFQESKKRKVLELSETNSLVSESEIQRKHCSRRGKKVKSNEEKGILQCSKEVVHVRARRGQATDSHSLAERVRRGKINERLKCLQDIVPGCYKTMGMAVMLDEIINYVQSLQNQVEFLSMKLTAASVFYDFNGESDAIETMQRAKAKELEKVTREEYYGGLNTSFHSTWSL